MPEFLMVLLSFSYVQILWDKVIYNIINKILRTVLGTKKPFTNI